MTSDIAAIAIACLGVIMGLFLAYIVWATVTNSGARPWRNSNRCLLCGRKYYDYNDHCERP